LKSYQRKKKKDSELTLAGCQTPTPLLSHSSSSTGQGEKVRLKSFWVKLVTGTSLTNYHHGQNKLDLGNIKFNYSINKKDKIARN